MLWTASNFSLSLGWISEMSLITMAVLWAVGDLRILGNSAALVEDRHVFQRVELNSFR